MASFIAAMQGKGAQHSARLHARMKPDTGLQPVVRKATMTNRRSNRKVGAGGALCQERLREAQWSG
jgi:hypothetical protein